VRAFDPGRHSLFTAAGRDRVLLSASLEDGWGHRFIVSTLSWFDIPGHTPLPRPDLLTLATHLDELEGSAPGDVHAWRAQDSGGASPELWFGLAELESFSEHNPALAPSTLSPERVERAVRDSCAAARATPTAETGC